MCALSVRYVYNAMPGSSAKLKGSRRAASVVLCAYRRLTILSFIFISLFLIVYFFFRFFPLVSENGKTYLPCPGVLRWGRPEGVDKKGGPPGGTFCEALHAPPRCVSVGGGGGRKCFYVKSPLSNCLIFFPHRRGFVEFNRMTVLTMHYHIHAFAPSPSYCAWPRERLSRHVFAVYSLTA